MNKTRQYNVKENHSFFPRFFLSKKFLVILFLGFLIARILYPLADPPKNLSWSLGLFFDEGIYNHNARNQILFGQWKLDEWNDYYYSAISTWIKYLVLRVIGVGRLQIRLISVIFSLISLLFTYLATKESYGKETGVLATLFLGTNYVYLMYNRLGLQETQLITIFIITFYFWQKGIKNLTGGTGIGWFFLAGIFCFITYTFKNLFICLIPVPFVTFGIYFIIQYRNYTLRKKLLQAFGYFSAGTIVVFVIWFLAFYLSYREEIARIGEYMLNKMMLPNPQPQQLLINLYQTPFFQYFSNNVVVLTSSFLFLLCLYYLFFTDQRLHIHASDIFLAIWFWAVFLFLGMLAYRPTRWFIPIIPPMCIFTARFVSLLSKASRFTLPKKLHWGFIPIAGIWVTTLVYYGITPYPELLNTSLFTPITTRNLFLSLFSASILTGVIWILTKRFHGKELTLPRSLCLTLALIVIAGSLSLDGRHYYQWVRAPEFVVHTVGRDLERYLGNNAYIAGLDAPGIAYDTPYKTLYAWDQFVNFSENPIKTYQLTHLFLANSPGVREKQLYFQKYPRKMQQATLLQQYIIKGTEFNLFSLVEPSVEEITVEKTELSVQNPLHVRIRVKNNDFRQPRKIYLNWFLYPVESEYTVNFVRAGQEVQSWLAPEQEQELAISGTLPENPGRYQLLASWNPVKEDVYEAEHTERHLGVPVHDIQAMGNQAVYHDMTTFPSAGFLVYGQYYRDYQPGSYEAIFRLKTENNAFAGEIVRIEVVAQYGRHVLQELPLRGTDFAEANRYHSFVLPFILKDYTPKVEFRVFSYGKVNIWADEIRVVLREGMWYDNILEVQN